MATIHLLKTSDMPDVPISIKLVENYGFVSIHTTQPTGFISGDHIVINGTEAAIRDWLRSMDGFWLGVGAPFMQKFEIAHIS